MDEQAVQQLLDEEAALWARLSATLDAAGPGALHRGDDGAEWSARDTWAHLGRWIQHASAYIHAYRADHAPPSISDPDAVNARWRAEDGTLPGDRARTRALAARVALRALVASIPAGAWDETIRGVLDINTTAHYREHLGYIGVDGGRA